MPPLLGSSYLSLLGQKRCLLLCCSILRSFQPFSEAEAICFTYDLLVYIHLFISLCGT